MRFLIFLSLILITVISCDFSTNKKEVKEKEVKGNIKPFHFPFHEIDSLVVYRYKTTQVHNDIPVYDQTYVFIEKTKDGYLEVSGFNDKTEQIFYSKLSFEKDGLIELERRQTLGETELAHLRFSVAIKLLWEQSSFSPIKEKMETEFKDQNELIELKMNNTYTFDGFARKHFSFTSERQCAKIKSKSYLDYYDSSGQMIAQTALTGYVLDLKGVGPAFTIEEGIGYYFESILVEIIKGEKAQLLKGLMC